MKKVLKMFEDSANQELAARFAGFIETAREKELFHIDVCGLAQEFGVNRKTMLEFCVIGLHRGLFIMEWEYHCPYCGLVTNETLSIHDATHENFCELCNVSFVNKLDDTVEVFFSVHPQIKKINEKYKKDYKAQMKQDIEKTKPLPWKTEKTISGVEIIQNPLYRELFQDEILLPDQSLEIMKVSILFTDIKGSTQLYTDLGDSKAFLLVRDHFRILFEKVKKHNGVPVKTIGDAVMGVFTEQADAVRAAFEIQKTFEEYNFDKPHRLDLKIGIHTGTTIVVTLNGKLDYFGTTVNMAARVQSRALPKGIVISAELFEDPTVKKEIIKYTNKVKTEKTALKGLAGTQNLYHIDIFGLAEKR